MIDALLTIKSSKSVCNQHRAQYRVLQYMIEDNKLWWLRGEIAICGWAQVECIMKDKMKTLAFQQHMEQGHWHHDSIKIVLMDHIWCPGSVAMAKADVFWTNGIYVGRKFA